MKILKRLFHRHKWQLVKFVSDKKFHYVSDNGYKHYSIFACHCGANKEVQITKEKI